MRKKVFLRFWVFSFIFIYEELLLQLFVFRQATPGMLYATLFALPAAAVCTVLCGLWPRRVNAFLTPLFLWIFTILMIAQLIYYDVFKTFMVFYSITHGAGNALHFVSVILQTIAKLWWKILLLLLPLLLYYILPVMRRRRDTARLGWKMLAVWGLIAVILHCTALTALYFGGTEADSPYGMYHHKPLVEQGVRSLGVMTFMRRDAMRDLFGIGDSEDGRIEILDESKADLSSAPESQPESHEESIEQTSLPDISGQESEESSQTPESSPEESEAEPLPAEPQPRVLDIDFDRLTAEAPNDTIAALHRYFRDAEPTYTNEYTGLFKGYNLIWIVAESFYEPFIDEELTPTLYKMATSSFVFTNFYTAYFDMSTSDGEFSTLTGLLPKAGIWSFDVTKTHQMPFGFGNILTPMGYTCRAYHNHDYNFYNRHETHPNMGFVYKAKKNGLDVRDVFPESDLEMMQLSIDDYIDHEPFCVYYMTVSGHLPYTWYHDQMAIDHRDVVEGMDASEGIQTYIAGNMEVEYALQYLMERLEESGALDHTVFALTADHYPYGLSEEEICTMAGRDVLVDYELYKNCFLLYCPGMEETVVVDKPGSNIDVMPTLANLFDLPVDSRLVMGRDLLSDSDGLIIFGAHSFITDKGLYNAKTKRWVSYNGEEVSQDYIDSIKARVDNKFTVSAAVIEKDYYAYLADELPWWNGVSYGHLFDPETGE
ncbi:MAG: LTA synthase family protein [Firmicutes bacterium]|nr:LTA synthase family protein [Bacillota bacterium]